MHGDELRDQTAPDGTRIDRELVIPAAVDDVWEIVIGDGWLAEEVALELFPGGDARFVGRDSTRNGWVEEVEPPDGGDRVARLVFWWGPESEPASRVELTLEPEGEGVTRLRVAETRPLDVLDLTGIPLPGSGGHSYGPSMLALA